MLADGREKGIEFVLPVDFVLEDGRVAETLGPDDQQFDVGPKTQRAVRAEGRRVHRRTEAGKPPPWRFTTACSACSRTRGSKRARKRFIPQLKRMKDAGIEVYVGGGEGGTALEKYGQPDWVTHMLHRRRHGAQRPRQRTGAVSAGAMDGGEIAAFYGGNR